MLPFVVMTTMMPAMMIVWYVILYVYVLYIQFGNKLTCGYNFIHIICFIILWIFFVCCLLFRLFHFFFIFITLSCMLFTICSKELSLSFTNIFAYILAQCPHQDIQSKHENLLYLFTFICLLLLLVLVFCMPDDDIIMEINKFTIFPIRAWQSKLINLFSLTFSISFSLAKISFKLLK